jgi:hypothetical protein
MPLDWGAPVQACNPHRYWLAEHAVLLSGSKHIAITNILKRQHQRGSQQQSTK